MEWLNKRGPRKLRERAKSTRSFINKFPFNEHFHHSLCVVLFRSPERYFFLSRYWWLQDWLKRWNHLDTWPFFHFHSADLRHCDFNKMCIHLQSVRYAREQKTPTTISNRMNNFSIRFMLASIVDSIISLTEDIARRLEFQQHHIDRQIWQIDVHMLTVSSSKRTNVKFHIEGNHEQQTAMKMSANGQWQWNEIQILRIENIFFAMSRAHCSTLKQQPVLARSSQDIYDEIWSSQKSEEKL